MNLKEAQEFLEKEISSLEQGIYTFEMVVRPRYDADKQILRNMKDQHVRLLSLIERVNNKEEITQKDIYDAVPSALR
jgi:hypothetical protein